MCGIVGGIAERNVSEILLEGLRRLEYRGYDSAGVAILSSDSQLQCVRRQGKVQELARAMGTAKPTGGLGIAHTRWATHGAPSEANAHPHISKEHIAIVHNGIIENHDALRVELTALGYQFMSQTDTEVIAHLIEHYCHSEATLLAAVRQTVARLEGAFALGVIDTNSPERLIAARSGSPLVIGIGSGEHFISSDQLALLQVTDRFMVLEEGDFAEFLSIPDKI